ncbi:hypothetical protein LQZ18_01775 [Lachnospiraceae bacterium ZAX-1]
MMAVWQAGEKREGMEAFEDIADLIEVPDESKPAETKGSTKRCRRPPMKNMQKPMPMSMGIIGGMARCLQD